MELSWLMPVLMYVLIPAILINWVMQQFGGKFKGKTLVEKPRDQQEAIYKDLRKSAILNQRKIKQKVYLTGDKIVTSKRMGTLLGHVLWGNQYYLFVRTKPWRFWTKAQILITPVDLCPELHTKTIWVHGRDWQTFGKFSWIIPKQEKQKDMDIMFTNAITNIEQLYMQKLALEQIPQQMNVNTLTASTGSREEVYKDITKASDPPSYSEEEIRMIEAQQYRHRRGGEIFVS